MSEKKVVSLYRSAFQLLGQDATGEYLFFIAFQNASQVAGTYTTDDVMGNNSGIYHFVGDDTVKIQFNSLMPNAVVTKNGGTCNAAVHFVSADSVLYEVTFEYADPVAATTINLAGTVEIEQSALSKRETACSYNGMFSKRVSIVTVFWYL